MSKSERYLAWYSGVVTLAFAAVVLTGAAASRNASFDRIDVQRIDVREPDGTLRMVVSNRASFPGAIFHGREYPQHVRPAAGMLFYNDEGTENGGLIFGGSKGADGKIESHGHLSFDKYDQDQVMSLDQSQEDGGERAGLAINDQPEGSLEPLIKDLDELEKLPQDERDKRMAQLQGEGKFANRLFAGKNRQHDAVVELKDADGKPRLRFSVSADGQARIAFLDAGGKVVRSLAPEQLAGAAK